jgi:hypothetical protein
MGMHASFPTNPAKKLPLPEVDSVDSPAALDLVARRIPFRCKLRDWGLLQWTIPYLKQKVGHVERDMIRVADGQRITITTSELLSWHEDDPGWKAKYLPVGLVGPPILLHHEAFAALLDDIRIPPFVTASYGAGVMIRNSRANADGEFYDTPCHYEDNVRPALYVQLLGRKTVWLFSPDEARHLGVVSSLAEPPHIANGADACWDPDRYPQLANATCYEVVVEPGDLLHWPEFWFHWFVHHHDLQMNLRLDWDPPRFELNPMSASWAYSNAVAAALGGFSDLESNFAALPSETRALLAHIEQRLIDRPELLHGRAMTLERFRLAAPVDQTAYKPPVAK